MSTLCPESARWDWHVAGLETNVSLHLRSQSNGGPGALTGREDQLMGVPPSSQLKASVEGTYPGTGLSLSAPTPSSVPKSGE